MIEVIGRGRVPLLRRHGIPRPDAPFAEHRTIECGNHLAGVRIGDLHDRRFGEERDFADELAIDTGRTRDEAEYLAGGGVAGDRFNLNGGHTTSLGEVALSLHDQLPPVPGLVRLPTLACGFFVVAFGFVVGCIDVRNRAVSVCGMARSQNDPRTDADDEHRNQNQT